MEAARQDGQFDWRKYLEAAVETITEGVIIISRDGRAVYANAAAENILCAKREDIVGRAFNDPSWKITRVDGRPIPDEQRPFSRAVRTGEPIRNTELAPTRPDGSMVILSISAAPLRDETGTVIAVVETFADITQRKRAQEAAEKSQKRFRSLIESTSDWVWEVDENAVYTYASPQVRELLGYEPEEVIGRTPFDLMPPEEAERVKALFNISADQKKPFSALENTNRHKDGRLVVLETSGVPFFDEKGRLRGYRGIDRDITERKKAEREYDRLVKDINAQRRLFQTVVDNAPAGIAVLLPPDYVYEYVNHVYESFAAGKAMLGKTLREVFPEVIPELLPVIERVMATGESYHAEDALVPIRRAPGASLEDVYFTFSYVRIPAFEEHGPALLVLVVETTERKLAEKALEEKDRSIRQAYVDVIGAVTGGKLILMTPEEIEAALGVPITDEYTIASYEELTEARRILRNAIKSALPTLDPDEFMVAVGEALTNAIKHAGSGVYRLFEKDGVLQIVISDSGPGIDFTTLPKATLMAGFSTKASLGLGFSIMLDLCDRVLLSSQPGNTTVVLEVGT